MPTPQVHGFAELDRADRTPAELAAFLQVIRAILLDDSPFYRSPEVIRAILLDQIPHLSQR